MVPRLVGLIFFFLIANTAFATSFSSIQFGGSVYRASYTTSAYDWALSTATDANHDVSLVAVGVNVTTFNGDDFGLLGSTNIQFSPLVGTTNSSSINIDDYNLKLSESGLLGIGYKFKQDWADFFVAGGLHFSAIMLYAEWKPYDGSARTETINTGINAGLGSVGLMRVPILSSLYFVSTISLGYDFIPLLNLDNYRDARILESSFSSGLGVSF